VSTSPITGVTNTTAAANPSASTSGPTKVNDGLGENAFLQLLVTQLQHQDPMQPQDDSQFLAQLAQFSSLEQLTQISNSIQQLVMLAGGNSTSTSRTSSTSTSPASDTHSGTTGGN
jgi:flagellar basal-body rod modification protein FlgD